MLPFHCYEIAKVFRLVLQGGIYAQWSSWSTVVEEIPEAEEHSGTGTS